jgi:hypothetical protein
MPDWYRFGDPEQQQQWEQRETRRANRAVRVQELARLTRAVEEATANANATVAAYNRLHRIGRNGVSSGSSS